jgi:hypothetical protein
MSFSGRHISVGLTTGHQTARVAIRPVIIGIAITIAHFEVRAE